MNTSIFMALASRMSGINRWNKSTPTQAENLNDHSVQTAFFCYLIGLARKELGREPEICPYQLAVYGLFHDLPEVITEDQNSKLKYNDSFSKMLSKVQEARAANMILGTLPTPMIEEVTPLLRQDLASCELKALVKAADLLSAYCKARAELRVGNSDFVDAAEGLDGALREYFDHYPEVRYVYEVFVPDFDKTIDKLVDSLPSPLRQDLPEPRPNLKDLSMMDTQGVADVDRLA